MKSQVDINTIQEHCIEVTQTLKAIAHPQRLMILCHLSESEKSVGELEDLCKISQSAVSQFLNRMRLEGILTSEKRGLYVFYKIADPRVKKLIASLQHLFCN